LFFIILTIKRKCVKIRSSELKRLKKKAIYQMKSALNKQILLHILWIIFFMQPISGLNAQSLQFNSLTIENGLSQNTINAIIQDDLGLIWIATQEGFNRYDGNEFKVYKQNTKEPHLNLPLHPVIF